MAAEDIPQARGPAWPTARPPFPAALVRVLARHGYTLVRVPLRGVPVWLLVPVAPPPTPVPPRPD